VSGVHTNKQRLLSPAAVKVHKIQMIFITLLIPHIFATTKVVVPNADISAEEFGDLRTAQELVKQVAPNQCLLVSVRFRRVALLTPVAATRAWLLALCVLPIVDRRPSAAVL
jgi:hypothetical protein